MPSDRDMSSGRTSEARSPRAPLARWNPNRDCWETDRVDLLSGLSDVWSETWPTSGTWADGSVYESPTWADVMEDSASSCSPVLPTPTVRDYKDSCIGVAHHRPEDRDTLSRALVDLI